MQNWSSEIQELTNYYKTLSGKIANLEKELGRLIKVEDEIGVLVSSRRCLEVIVTDICEKESIKLSKTIPLKGIIDKLNKEEKAPSHIISSMLNLNNISTYGAHPKEFDPRQVRTVLINLITIIEWYINYKGNKSEVVNELVDTPDPILITNEKATKKKKRKLIMMLSMFFLVVATVFVVFVIFNKHGVDKQAEDIANLEKTIAVLPFESLGSIEDKTALHDAIPIALIMELQNVEGFIIRPRGSTLKYKETDLRSPEIGKELKVNFLLKGFTQRQDKNVLVDIMLIRSESEEVIWNSSFEFETDDIFKIQRDISKQVASSLKNNFIPEEENLSDNPDAYLAFLTGLDYFWLDNEEGFLQAIRYFERAISLDSNFTLAHIKLAVSNFWRYHYYFDRTQDCLLNARKTLDKALEIDPENPDVICAEAIYYYVTHDYEKALEKFNLVAKDRVIDKTEFNLSFGSLYRRQLKLDKALEYFLKAAEVDPQNNITIRELAETYLLMRKYDLAEKYFNQSILMGVTYGSITINKTTLYLMKDEGTERSKQALEESISLMGKTSDPILIHKHMRILRIDREYEEALELLSQNEFKSIGYQFFYRPKSLYYAEVYRMQNNTKLAKLYYDSVRVHLENKIDITPDDSRYHSSLGIAYAGLGRKNDAIKEGEIAVSLMPITKDFYRGIFIEEDLARIYTMVGEYDLALNLLDKMLTQPGLISVNLLKKDPVWEPLWTNPEFEKMIKKYSED